MKRVLEVILALVLCLSLCACEGKAKKSYNEAVSYMESEQYVEAYKLFEELGDYQDSQEKLEEVKKSNKRQSKRNVIGQKTR